MLLLTAPPRTGKSTAIRKIITCLGIENCAGFWTEQITENGERVGFEINLCSGEKAVLAHVNSNSSVRVSRYGVDVEAFERICLPCLLKAKESHSYIIIDEIGPMQLFSNKYKQFLMELVNSKKVIGTIFYDSYPWIDEFKKLPQNTLLNLTMENRNEIPLQVIKAITKDDPLVQSKIERAEKYLMTPEIFSTVGNKVMVNSKHGPRTITFNKGFPACDCDFFKQRATCSHIIANTLRSR